MKKNGLWVIAFVIVALMVLTTVSPLSTNRTETIDNSTYIISNTPPDNPELGDLWYDTTLDEMNIYNGYVWQSLVPTVSGADYKNHVAKHYWGGVDPISFQELSPNIRVASEFATSGSGTESEPFYNAVYYALNDLPDTANQIGGLIFIPAGFYIEEHKLDIGGKYGHINLMGAGIRATFIKLANGVNDNFIEYVPTVGEGFSSVSNMRIDGNKAGQTSGHGIFADTIKAKDFRIYNVFVSNCKEDGIHIEMSWGLRLLDSLAEWNEKAGLNISDGNPDAYIVNFFASGNIQEGIIINSSKQLANCMSHNNGATYPCINITGDDNVLTGCIASSGQDGIEIGGKRNVITGGKITNPTRYGMHFINNAYFNLVSNTLIYNTGDDAFRLEAASYNIIKNNYLMTIGGGGIYIGASYNTFEGNVLYGITGAKVSGSLRGTVQNNEGYNPIGVVTGAFDNSANQIYPTGTGANSPTNPSTDYIVRQTPCRIISTDSGDANCSITIKDADGNTIESGLSTYDNWLEVGWTINWGAFTGTAPTVTVIFT